MNWTKALPYLASLATGGVPALWATAAAAIGEALGQKIEPTPAGIDAALKNATPEQLAVLKDIEAKVKIAMRSADTEDKKIDADVTKAYISDTDAARRAHSTNVGVLRLGYVINVLSYIVVAGVLYGCYSVLVNGLKLSIDPGLSATVGTVVGMVVQWVISNSNQANGFFFGSSPSARQNSAEMSQAVSAAIVSPPQRR